MVSPGFANGGEAQIRPLLVAVDFVYPAGNPDEHVPPYCFSGGHANVQDSEIARVLLDHCHFNCALMMVIYEEDAILPTTTKITVAGYKTPFAGCIFVFFICCYLTCCEGTNTATINI